MAVADIELLEPVGLEGAVAGADDIDVVGDDFVGAGAVGVDAAGSDADAAVDVAAVAGIEPPVLAD